MNQPLLTSSPETSYDLKLCKLQYSLSSDFQCVLDRNWNEGGGMVKAYVTRHHQQSQ